MALARRASAAGKEKAEAAMLPRLIQSQKQLHDSLFELYIYGGLELYLARTRVLKCELIIQLETSALTPERGGIIHFYAVNCWDEQGEFDDWAKPSVALSSEAERILGVMNDQLAYCRSTDVVLDDFASFISFRYFAKITFGAL
ncbi:hypothetical protein [Sphingorhabdus sp.]|uniref:hypothetical protein n=1 Tax=Sphingorhabdus sp. TaxID=1902408 RepID=UPI003784F404